MLEKNSSFDVLRMVYAIVERGLCGHLCSISKKGFHCRFGKIATTNFLDATRLKSQGLNAFMLGNIAFVSNYELAKKMFIFHCYLEAIRPVVLISRSGVVESQ